MAVLTEDGVRALAGFKGLEGPVTSCYLDVDGSRFPRPQEVEQALAVLMRRARSRGDVPPSVEADLRHIEHHVRAGIDRANVRGLAMFSSSASGFWEVYELPVGVTSQLVVNHSPAVTQLETLVEEHRPLGMLLVDRSQARAVVVALGEVVADELIEAEAPSIVPDGRASRSKGQAVVAAVVHRHEKRAADLAFELFRRHGVQRVVLGAPAEMGHDVLEALHPYLQAQLGGTVAIGPSATPEQVRRASLEAEERLERQAEAALVDRVRADVARQHRAVAGLPAVITMLNARRVDTLVVSHGYQAEGWRCGCGHLALMGRSCPACNEDMELVDDIVEDAVDEAFAHGARVEVCQANADLDVMGRIAALLRY